jgi:hypothetical protein
MIRDGWCLSRTLSSAAVSSSSSSERMLTRSMGVCTAAVVRRRRRGGTRAGGEVEGAAGDDSVRLLGGLGHGDGCLACTDAHTSQMDGTVRCCGVLWPG